MSNNKFTFKFDEKNHVTIADLCVGDYFVYANSSGGPAAPYDIMPNGKSPMSKKLGVLNGRRILRDCR